MFPISQYEEKISHFYKIMAESSAIADVKIAADKWTLKEMVGHLVDSASNNHQRFIRLQLEKKIFFPAYNQDEWKNATKITDFNFVDLITLWKGYNHLLLHIAKNFDEGCLSNVWVKDDKELSLKSIVEDYFHHMDWHVDLYSSRVEEILKKQQKALTLRLCDS